MVAIRRTRILWKAGVGTGFSSMVVSDGRLYTMGWSNDEDHVFCLNAVTGATKWIARYPRGLGNKMYEGRSQFDSARGRQPGVHGQQDRTDPYLRHRHRKPGLEKSLKEAVGAELSDWGVSGAPVLADARTLLINYGPHGVALDPETGAVGGVLGARRI